MRRLLSVSLLGCLSAAACHSDAPLPSELDPVQRGRDEVLIQLGERAAKLVDFAVSGQRCIDRCDGDTPYLQDFKVQLRSPGLFRIEVPAEETVVTFDGKELVTVAGKARTVQRQPITPGGKDATATLPYQVISGFLAEGWHAPLLATQGKVPARLAESADGKLDFTLVVLERPLVDSSLKQVEFWYRLPKADFVRKRFVLTSGAVTKATEVVDHHSDPRSGYGYPSHWRILDGQGTVIGWTRLTEIAINAGVAKNLFTAQVPEGFTPVP